MYLSDFYIPVNTPLGGWGAATQTFAPGGKYPRAATDNCTANCSDLAGVGVLYDFYC